MLLGRCDEAPHRARGHYPTCARPLLGLAPDQARVTAALAHRRVDLGFGAVGPPDEHRAAVNEPWELPESRATPGHASADLPSRNGSHVSASRRPQAPIPSA